MTDGLNLASPTIMNASNRTKVEKIVLAQKVGQFLTGTSDKEKRSVVEGVARVLANDVSIVVRQTLSFELRRSPFVPPEVAQRIARDVEDVAGPFLAATEIFTNEELAELVAEVEEHAREAIARRSTVPGIVSDALCTHAGERAITFLVRNRGAELTELACCQMVERFEDATSLLDNLARRVDLPLSIAEKLITKVSDACRDVLVEHYDLGTDLAHTVVEESRATSIGEFLESADQNQIDRYVKNLKVRGELSAEMILTMTKRGSVRFFNAAMAARANTTTQTIKGWFEEKGLDAIEEILETAKISASHTQLFKIALQGLYSNSGSAR